MKTPEVRIYFSWLLYEKVSKDLHGLYGKEDKLEDPDTLVTYARNYKYEWAKYSDRILAALCDALGVEFYQTIIDAPCTPWVTPISSPLTLNFYYYPDQFVDVLMHELCHVLLDDNTTYSIYSSNEEINFEKRWSKLFGSDHDFHTLGHIPVHALSKYIYLDILKEPKRLERDINNLKHLDAYKAAWDYVNAHDYKEIIAQLKQDYQNIKQELVA